VITDETIGMRLTSIGASSYCDACVYTARASLSWGWSFRCHCRHCHRCFS